jgi:NAD(P)-dependent dehydrogenase (short-subunit alcohol dehydrogenase family)
MKPMTKPSPQFGGQISIVTGAESGIGLATAEGLAAGGAIVVGVDWKGAEEAAAEVPGAFSACRCFNRASELNQVGATRRRTRQTAPSIPSPRVLRG